jgi:O-antigen/teichoic acid export membrane protein
MLDGLKKYAFSRISLDLKKVIANIGWLFIDQFIQIGMAFGVGIWVARYLGPEQFGLISYAIAFTSLFLPFVDLGLRSLVVRDIAHDDSHKYEILGTTFSLQLVSGILCFALSVGIALLLPNEQELFPLYVAIISAGLIFVPFETIDYWFQSQINSKYTVIAKNSAFFLISAFRIVLINIKAATIFFVWGKFFEQFFTAIGLTVTYLLRNGSLLVWKINLARARSLLSESWPVLLAGLTNQIYSRIDQVMLGSMLEDKSQLAFYSAAVKLAEVFNFLPVMMASSLLPKLTELRFENPQKYNEKFQVYFDIMTLIGLGIALPISFIAPWIITLSYGEYYSASSGLLAVYIWAQLGTNLGVARGTWFIIEGKVRWSLYAGMIGVFTNILLNLYLIPRYEAMGATVATLITYFLVTVLVNPLFRDLHFVSGQIFRSFNLLRAISRVVGVFR